MELFLNLNDSEKRIFNSTGIKLTYHMIMKKVIESLCALLMLMSSCHFPLSVNMKTKHLNSGWKFSMDGEDHLPSIWKPMCPQNI